MTWSTLEIKYTAPFTTWMHFSFDFKSLIYISQREKTFCVSVVSWFMLFIFIKFLILVTNIKYIFFQRFPQNNSVTAGSGGWARCILCTWSFMANIYYHADTVLCTRITLMCIVTMCAGFETNQTPCHPLLFPPNKVMYLKESSRQLQEENINMYWAEWTTTRWMFIKPCNSHEFITFTFWCKSCTTKHWESI